MLYEFFLLVQKPRVRRRAFKHWVLWMGATAFGWAVAGFTGLPLGRIVVAERGAESVFSAATTMGLVGMLIGGMIGVSQWMYLRWRIRGANWWIPATALGWGVGLPLALSINLLAGSGLSAILYGVVIGGMAGFWQWMILKRCTGPAGRWVLMSVVAIPVGILLAGTFDQRLLLNVGNQWEEVRWFTAMSGGIAGLSVGLLTGVTLLALLARQRENP